MDPPPLLRDHASGVVLRAWRPADAPALATAWADPEIAGEASVPGAGDPDDARRWIAGVDARREAGMAVDVVIDALAGDGGPAGRVLGEVGLARLVLRDRTDPSRTGAEWDVGWWVVPGARGRGVATAAVRLLVRWAVVDAGRPRVVARIAPTNVASQAVAAQAGLVRRGRFDAERDLWVGPAPGADAAQGGDPPRV